jgi:hypothetical protein
MLATFPKSVARMSNRLELVAALVVVASCGGDSTSAVRSVRSDSAGVEVVVHPADVLEHPLRWSINSEPLVVIGVEAGDEHQQFYHIGGVAVLGADRIAVLNAGTSEVRVFDMAGRYLMTVGRRGAGPGEFQYPRLLTAFGRDSLLVYDMVLRRFATVTADGAIHAFTGLSGRHRGMAVAATAEGDVLTQRSTATARPDSPEEILTNNLRLGLLAKGPPDGATGDAQAGDSVFAEIPGQKLLRWKVGDRFGFATVPYDVAPVAAAGPHGFFVLLGALPEVRQYSSAGTLVRIIRFAGAAQPLAPAAFAARVDSIVNAATPEERPELRRRYGLMEAPATAPIFDHMLLGEGGELWLRRAGESNWFVLDSIGTPLGQLPVPPGLIVSQVRHDLILGRTRDELGVERVQAHHLVRR